MPAMVSDDYINIQDMRANNFTLKYSTTKSVTCNDYIFYIYIYKQKNEATYSGKNEETKTKYLVQLLGYNFLKLDGAFELLVQKKTPP